MDPRGKVYYKNKFQEWIPGGLHSWGCKTIWTDKTDKSIVYCKWDLGIIKVLRYHLSWLEIMDMNDYYCHLKLFLDFNPLCFTHHQNVA